MGNGHAKLQEGLKGYILVNSFVVDALGTIIVYRDPNNEEFKTTLQTSYAIGNKALAENDLEQMRRINTTKNSCKFVYYEVIKNKKLCLESFSLYLVFETYPLTLSSCISQQKNFTENDLWKMTENMLVYLAELKGLGLCDGDLQPKNIFYVPGCSLKFLNLLMFTTYQNAYKMKLAYRPYNSTFAPELMIQLKNSVINPDYDPHKADIFSLGICLLCAATSTPFEYFYNFNDYCVLFENIKQKLVEIVDNKRYSTELFAFIDYCVLINPLERPYLDILYKKLPGVSVVTSSVAFWGKHI